MSFSDNRLINNPNRYSIINKAWSSNNLYNKYYSKYINQETTNMNQKRIEEIEATIEALTKEIGWMKKPKITIGSYVRIKSTGSSVGCASVPNLNNCYGGKSSGDVAIVLHIDGEHGCASKEDPRYYGEGFNVRGCDLELITKEEFDTQIEAALAYNLGAIEHHGEFAMLNFK